MTYPFAAEMLSRRAVAAAIIIALHVVVAYCLATGLVHQRLIEVPVLLARVLPEPPQPPPKTVEPIVKLAGPRRVVEHSVPPVHWEEPSPPPFTTGPTLAPGPAIPPLPEEPLRILGHNELPGTEEFYPPELRRLGIGGASYVRVCVDAAGVRQGEPVLEDSSGNERIDAGALNVARHGRYARAVRGDTPVPNCYRFRITFRVN